MKISVLNGVEDIRQHFSDKVGKELKIYRQTASMHAKIATYFFLFWKIQLNLLKNGNGTVLRQYQHIFKWNKQKVTVSISCL